MKFHSAAVVLVAGVLCGCDANPSRPPAPTTTVEEEHEVDIEPRSMIVEDNKGGARHDTNDRSPVEPGASTPEDGNNRPPVEAIIKDGDKGGAKQTAGDG